MIFESFTMVKAQDGFIVSRDFEMDGSDSLSFGSLFCMHKHLAAEPIAPVFFKYEKFVHKRVAPMIFEAVAKGKCQISYC